MVNGNSGRTNGLNSGVSRDRIGIASGRTPSGEVSRRDMRIGAMIICVAYVAIPLLGLMIGSPPPQTAFVVDGDFGEWAGVLQYPDAKDARLDSVDLESFAVHTTQYELLVYGRTEAPLFSGSIASSVYVFFSSGSRGPGYAGPGMDAHFVAELYGWDGSLEGVTFREWTGGPDPDNATAFLNHGIFPAAVVGREFEFSLDDTMVGFTTSPDLQLRIALSTAGVSDLGAAVGLAPGALVVDQRPIASVVSANAPVLELRMRALGGDVSVSGISVERVGGGAGTLPATPFVVRSGTERVEEVYLDPAGLLPGAFVTLRVTGVTATAVGSGNSVPLTLLGAGARVYVAASPTGKTIDGLFDDWTSVDRDADDTAPDSVDLWESANALAADAFFYLRTEGEVLGGSLLPDTRVPRIQDSGPAPNASVFPIRREAGEDILRIFVDTDDRSSIGQSVLGLVADRRLEIRGRMGRITSKELSAWNGTLGGWELQAHPFPVAFVGTRLEASAPLAFLGPTNNPTLVFASTDWSGGGDVSDPAGLRGTPGEPGLLPLHGPGARPIAATPLANIPLVDGFCDFGNGEYDNASMDFTLDMSFSVGRRDDTGFVYLCLAVFSDTTPSLLDWGELLFDTAHNGGIAPALDDRRFRVHSGFSPLIKERGTGVAWGPCGLACNPGDFAVGNFSSFQEVYEFQIHYTDVWGIAVPPPGRRAGFAIVAHNEGLPFNYTWGSTAVNDMSPNTWGHIDIIVPEFEGIAWVVVVVAALGITRHRRSRRGA